MRLVALLLALLVPASVAAKGKARPTRAPRPPSSASAPVERAPSKAEKTAPVSSESSADGDSGGESAATKTADGKTLKTKTYTFGAMDVEGKLKTPQLLYFLNRVKLELDMSAPDKRSFMKELARSADDKSL